MSAQSDAPGGHFNPTDSDPRGSGRVLSGLLNDMQSSEMESSEGRPGHGHGKPEGGASRIELSRLGTFASGLGEASAEIVAHDPATQRLFVTNSNAATVDILDVADPSQPVKLASIDMSVIDGMATGGPNSVAVAGGIVAVAVEAAEVTDPGKVAFFDADGGFLGAVEVGALPDMLTFTPDGSRLLVANEGEPGDVDPKGSVSIVDLSGGVGAAVVTTVDFTAFDAQQAALEAAGLRIFDGQLLSDDVEPEHIGISGDGKTAFIALQEANAVAVLDIASATIKEIQPLGAKDHSEAGNGLDPSDRDDGINIRTAPVSGLYMPDAIASFEAKGKTYYVTANEGDARDEVARVEDLDLDPAAFPDAATLQEEENIGRLEVSTIDGDADGDGDYEQLYAYGARSFSIWDEDGKLVFDSGDMIEQLVAELTPELFNADEGDPEEFDTRSDAKGPEPEAVTIGEIDGRTYAFVGLERVGGGVMMFDITSPHKVEFVQYARTEGDIAPEGLQVISAEDSPTGAPLLAVANEVSGTTTLYRIGPDDEANEGGKHGETLSGTAGDDTLEGGKGDDQLHGEEGDDVMIGGRGNDEHDGGAGSDTVVFSGKSADYFVETDLGIAVDLRSGRPDGVDGFQNVEFLQFADETVSLGDEEEGDFTLQILHASDLEGGVDAIGRAANFAAIVDTLEDEVENSI